MAIPCQGFTVRWGTATLSEVSALEIPMQRGLPVSRSDNWTPNLGEVRILTFSGNVLPASAYGQRKLLQIVAPVDTSGATLTLLNTDAIYQDANVTAAANDAIRFAYTFKVMDTVGAPSNP